ncbi:S8 family serine peptidase [Halobacillus sp. Marseille-P3879]|uniref:S8 family serine peptidase n=1 Tax=Halobacillus sp. Marseille-P3879 TaxID=2045014 RepID=UPI000C7CC706|nr:S8 family serine peptidase [Halobacillus sp. Marseille-P3879]
MRRKKRIVKSVSILLITVLILSFFNMTSVSFANESNNLSVKDSKQTASKINEDLSASFKEEDQVTYLVKMKEQADTKKAADEAVQKLKDSKASVSANELKRVQNSAVVHELRATSKDAQNQLNNYLNKAEEQGDVTDFQSYYIVNAFSVTSNKKAMEEISTFAEVEKILPNRTRKIYQPVEAPKNEVKADTLDVASWGIDRIGAEQVWDETGIDGSGVVVANIDTGVQWDHPGLMEKYRGFNAENPDQVDHEFNWYDATADEPEPYDDQGHGTHTMGTVAGSEDDDSNQVGVAPGSKWIAVKAFTSAGGTDVDLLEAAEWLLAPKDEEGNPHPEKAPDVINNSWGGGPGLDEWYREMVQNWRNAGIAPVFSAGNDGETGDGSIAAPANYPESIAVGATDNTDDLAYFSSVGPSPYDGEIKPDISAPGVNINSTVPGSEYDDTYSGTSMAGPHVAGTVALLLEADQSLTVDQIEELLYDTADPATSDDYPDDPNEGFGNGITNAYTAVSAVVSGIGEIIGNVYEEGDDTEAPVIEHEPLTESYKGLELPIVADISDNVSVDHVEVQYRVDNEEWQTADAELIEGNFENGTYQASIPGDNLNGESLEYKLMAADFGENEAESDVYTIELQDGITVGYSENFENTPAGWVSFGESNSWEWGEPDSGPDGAASGEKVYATNLEGTYESNADMTLRLPPVEVPVGDTYLQFKSWYELERNYDYGHVVVSTDNENWEQLAEFNDESEDWTESQVDLSEYEGQTVYVGFHVGTDGSVVKDGWYIDDVALTDQSSDTAAKLHKSDTKKTSKVEEKGASKDAKSDKKKKRVKSKSLFPGPFENVEGPLIQSGEVDTSPISPKVLPLEATVSVLETDKSVTTDPSDGSYRILTAAGEYTLEASAYGYNSSTEEVEVTEDGQVNTNFTLDPMPSGEVTGTVTNERTGDPIEGATVYVVEDAAVTPVETDENGVYSLTAYEGDYTLEIRAPGYKGAEASVTVEGNETVTEDVQLEPFIGFPGEIGYDDGTAENARAFYDAGNSWAVRMSLEEGQSSALVTGGLFRFWEEDFPVPGGTEFEVAVYDSNGEDGAPGDRLAGPVEADALRNGEWTEVDVSEEGIVVDDDFYMVYIQTHPNPDTPALATDENGENAGRSWQQVGGTWSPSPSEEGNYMIRATVDYEAEAPVIESPADRAFTNDESITVEGNGSPSSTIEIFNGEEEVAAVETNEEGDFAADLELNEGENELTAVTVTDNGNTEPSDPVVVTLDQTAPELSITSPENGDKINSEVTTVEGTVNEDNLDHVIVNGEEASVDEDGSFTKRLIIDEGENVIEIEALDQAGNSATEEVTIEADYTVPELTNIMPDENLSLQSGESVKIEFDSEAGLEATFYIKMPLTNFSIQSDQAIELPMRETEDGHYEGYWTATSNLEAEGAEVIVKAEDQFGNLSEEVAEGKLDINQ